MAFALNASPVHSDSAVVQAAIEDESLAAYAELVKETELRRRVNVLYPNPQSIFDGLQVGYVSVRHGNLTFGRRDIVAGSNTLAKFVRVYDSRALRGRNFGPGWRLSLDEELTAADDRVIYTDGSGARHYFVSSLNGQKGLDTEPAVSGQFPLVADGELPKSSSFPASGSYTAYPITPQHASTSIEVAGPLAVLRSNTETRVFERLDDGMQGANTYTYRLSHITSRDGKFIALSYRNGLIRIVSDADGPLFEVVRDRRGRIVSVHDRWGRSVYYIYDSLGRLSETLDIAGNLWRYEYAQHGRLVRAIGPNQKDVIRIRYDDTGRVTESQTAREYRFAYFSGETIVTEGIGHSHVFGHNTAGITDRLESTTGVWWQLEMDEQNRVTQTRSHNGNHEYSYGPRGELTSDVAASGSSLTVNQFNYDERGRIVSVASENEGSVNVEYAGELTRISGPNGTFAFEIIPQGRITSVRKENTHISANYDAQGNLVALVNENRSVQFGRNLMGRVAYIRYANGEENHYSYDELGNRASISLKSGGGVRYMHDAAGNIVEVVVTQPDGATKRQFVDIGDMNRVEKITYEGLGTLGISYDGMGRAKTFDTGQDTISVEYEGPSRIGKIVSRTSGAVWWPDHDPDRQEDTADMSDVRLQVMHDDSVGLSHAEYGVVRFSDAGFSMSTIDPTELGIHGLREARSLYSVAEPMFSSKEFEAILEFEKPSNPVFQPLEYRSTNCCICYITQPNSLAARAVRSSTMVCVCYVDSQPCEPTYQKPTLYYPPVAYQDFIPDSGTEPALDENGGDLGISLVTPNTRTLKCKEVCDGQYQLTGGITVDNHEDRTFIKIANYAKAAGCIKSLRFETFQDHAIAHEQEHVGRLRGVIDRFNDRFGATFGSRTACNTERNKQLITFGLLYRFAVSNEESHFWFRGQRKFAVGCPAPSASSVEFFCGEDDRFDCDGDTY